MEPQPVAFLPEKVVAPSSFSRSNPWGPSLTPAPSPRVSGTPWRGGTGRQVQRLQALTAPGSVRPQFGPFLPCPTDGSPEAGSSPPRELSAFIQKGAGCAGSPVPQGTSRLQSLRPPTELVPEVAGDLGLASYAPKRSRCFGRTPATKALRAPALHSAPKPGEPWGQQRGAVA